LTHATDAAEDPSLLPVASTDSDQAAPDEAESTAPPYLPRRHHRSALWICVALATVAALFVAVLATRPSAESKLVDSPLLGKPAPTLDGATVDGSPLHLSNLRGRWVLVNFFATWCVPCRREHPDLVRFQAAHRGPADVQIVGVIYSDTVSAVRDFRDRNGGDWPMVTDSGGRIALDFGVSGVPESFLISPSGVVVSKLVGGVSQPGLERLLVTAQGQVPGT